MEFVKNHYRGVGLSLMISGLFVVLADIAYWLTMRMFDVLVAWATFTNAGTLADVWPLVLGVALFGAGWWLRSSYEPRTIKEG